MCYNIQYQGGGNMENELLKAISTLLDEKLDPVKEDIKGIKSTLDEHSQILRALEHSAEVNKADYNKIAHDIANIKGAQEGLRKDLNNVELITASNWAEITRLKAIKQP